MRPIAVAMLGFTLAVLPASTGQAQSLLDQLKKAGRAITAPITGDHRAARRGGPPGAETRAERREIQARLNELGFDAGTPDGIFGPQTREAMRGYQQSIGEEPTGSLTEAQIDRLLGRADTAAAAEGGTGEAMPEKAAGEETVSGESPAEQAALKAGGAPPPAAAGAPVFKDCEVCPEMVEVPPGEFMMGAVDAERRIQFIGRDPYALPRHKVTIGYRFAIGRFEVTAGEFGAYVEETGAEVGGTCGIRLMEKGPNARKFKGTRHPDAGKEQHGPFYTYITDGSYAQPGLPVTDRQPAVCVSRNEVTGYLGWLSEKTGRDYRLPTEAEWEYAARAGTDGVSFWGNDLRKACDYANFGDKASGYQAGFAAPCAEKTRPAWTAEAGSYKPNPWGIHDMPGNAQEMLEDCWSENYDNTPADGSPYREDGCKLFIARGGDYELMFVSMRLSERLFFGYAKDLDHVQGEDAAFNGRSNVMGFRAAVSLDDTAWDRK